jgi:hypothetical protein
MDLFGLGRTTVNRRSFEHQGIFGGIIGLYVLLSDMFMIP